MVELEPLQRKETETCSSQASLTCDKLHHRPQTAFIHLVCQEKNKQQGSLGNPPKKNSLAGSWQSILHHTQYLAVHRPQSPTPAVHRPDIKCSTLSKCSTVSINMNLSCTLEDAEGHARCSLPPGVRAKVFEASPGPNPKKTCHVVIDRRTSVARTHPPDARSPRTPGPRGPQRATPTVGPVPCPTWNSNLEGQ